MSSSLKRNWIRTKINSKEILLILIFFIIVSNVYFINFRLNGIRLKSESNSQINEQNININEEIVYQKNNLNESIWWSTEIRGNYTVLRNYITSDEKSDYSRSITLTTQCTYSFLYHIEIICRQWDGHISVAVYCPGHDFNTAINLIYYLRQCKDSCVKRKTSWHFVYNTIYSPQSNISFPSSSVNHMSISCDNSFEDVLKKYKESFRSSNSLTYPINVVRNVARLNARTEYVFATDIELYPSLGIVPAFLDLIDREKSGLVPMISRNKPHVYVFPVFEVEETVEPPMTKPELIQLLKSGKAISFHKSCCDKCHAIPGRDEWIELNWINNTLGIFHISKRQRDRNRWEPFYIGTNADPLWDERLTWEGKINKMQQAYELCLMDYEFAILDNAFLVHAPGIKNPKDWAKDRNRKKSYMKENNKVFEIIERELTEKYGDKNNC